MSGNSLIRILQINLSDIAPIICKFNFLFNCNEITKAVVVAY